MKNNALRLRNVFVEEFDSDSAVITDFDFCVRGARIDYVQIDTDGTPHFFAGNPECDEHWEELVLSEKLINWLLVDIANMYDNEGMYTLDEVLDDLRATLAVGDSLLFLHDDDLPGDSEAINFIDALTKCKSRLCCWRSYDGGQTFYHGM